jgi:Spy/CpxP family protein refolding chaperone
MTRPAAWKVLLYTVALFIAGAVCGAMVMSRRTPAADQPLKLGRTGEIADRIRTKLDARLQLTPDQQQKFDPLFVKTSTELEAIHKDCLDRITAALDQLHVEMGPGLTPEQLQSVKALEAERREQMLEKYNYNYCAATTNSVAH